MNSRINLEKKLRRQELKVARTAGLINQDLRSKIEKIEDLEAIRRLKAAYCDACDDDHNGDSVSTLFTKGGTWQQSGQTGQADSRVHVGRKEIADFMYGLRNAGFIVRSSHIVTNPIIQISGASASGKWKFLMLYTLVCTLVQYCIYQVHTGMYTSVCAVYWWFRLLAKQVSRTTLGVTAS